MFTTVSSLRIHDDLGIVDIDTLGTRISLNIWLHVYCMKATANDADAEAFSSHELCCAVIDLLREMSVDIKTVPPP